MNPLLTKLPRITGILLIASLGLLLFRAFSDVTPALIIGSIVMFACCLASAIHLLGGRATTRFVLIAVVLGWIAEELGATRGWIFGSYDYTNVLGPQIGAVPFVIPLMWFALCYIAYVIANLIVWQKPADAQPGQPTPLLQEIIMSLLAAMIVTAYDLGADPYMVFVLKAWIMAKKDGWWFGETLQGFVGWMSVSFTIIMIFRLSLRKLPPVPALPATRRDMVVPLFIYGGNMVFQAFLGSPVETRTIALFAMGIPLMTALCGFVRWNHSAADAVPATATASEPAPVRRQA